MGNPLVGTFATKDDRHISLCCLQAGKYWGEFVTRFGRPELATDERFADYEGMAANSAEGAEILRAAILAQTSEELRPKLEAFSGQWTWVQNTLEVVDDPQAVANGYVSDCANSEGEAFQLVTAPIQYGGVPAQPGRSPDFNEHGDAILEGLGLDMDAIIDLKVKGVVA
jgi:crotonobetainyl-CoA:carnitine CoA-transferase CaiB-like acyl-CoA transferase